MGVTLERVQNKFACIIGELCNEPDVMSQFAIWVDLRISEYKTKGAISLECSGEDPNPTWLRGFKPNKRERTPIKNISYSRRVHQESAMSPGVQRSWDNSTNSPDGSDFVHIEPSPHDSVFPLKIEHNRKRSAIEDPYVSQNSVSPSKSIRLSNSYLPDFSQTIVAEPTNESLMSIIGAGDSENLESTDTKPSVETIVLDDCNPDQDTVTPSTSGGITQSEFRDSNSSLHQPSTSNSDDASWSMPDDQQLDSSANFQLVQGSVRSYSGDTVSTDVAPRISPFPPKTPQTVTNLISGVGSLQRWLKQAHNETRYIETISPDVLDRYLSVFFAVTKRPSGIEYGAEGLKNIRCSICRFLEEAGYFHKITKSELFSSSQRVYRQEFNRRKAQSSKKGPDVSSNGAYS